MHKVEVMASVDKLYECGDALESELSEREHDLAVQALVEASGMSNSWGRSGA